MSQSSEVAAAGQSTGAERGRWLGLAVVVLTHLMIVVDMTIVNVALPSIRADLQIEDAQRHWVITAYTLAFGGLLLVGGRVGDYIGRKQALVVGLCGFAVASGLGGAAASLPMLLAARVAQGAFGALLAPAALALIATTFTEPKDRAKAFGIFGAAVGAGSPLGLILGGVLTSSLSWHWVFYVNIPIGVLAVVGALAFLRDTPPQGGGGIDLPGAVLASGGLVALVYGFTLTTQLGFGSPITLGVLAVGFCALVLFVLMESRVSNPLVPLSVLWHRGRGGAYLVIVLMMTGPFGAYLLVSFYLQGVREYSALLTGVAFLPLSLGVMLASTLTSRLITRVPPRVLMAPGLFLGALGMLLLTRLQVDSGYAVDVLPSLVMIGVGMGMVVPQAVSLATSDVRPTEAGVASAMFNVSQQVGASVGTAVLNTVAAAATAGYLAGHQGSDVQLIGQVEGYNMATWWGAGILAVAGLVALVLVNTRPGGAPGAK